MNKDKKPQFANQKGSTVMSLWNTLKEAISGSDCDFTKIPLGKAIFLLAIPMVFEMIMESVFALVDIFFVSKLGSDAVATVGITESVLTLIYAVAFGFAIGITALVSRRIGENRKREASKEGLQAIITGVIISLIIAIPGVIFAKDLLQLMGASKTIVNEYSSYPSIMFGGNIVIMLLFLLNQLCRCWRCIISEKVSGKSNRCNDINNLKTICIYFLPKYLKWNCNRF